MVEHGRIFHDIPLVSLITDTQNGKGALIKEPRPYRKTKWKRTLIKELRPYEKTKWKKVLVKELRPYG